MSSVSPQTVYGFVPIPSEWRDSIGFIVGKGGSGIHNIRQFAGKGTTIHVTNDQSGNPTHFSINVIGFKDLNGKMNRAVWKINQIFEAGLPSNKKPHDEKPVSKKTPSRKATFAYMMDQLSDSDDDIDQDLQSNEDDIVQHEEKISRVGKPPRNFFKKPTRTGN